MAYEEWMSLYASRSWINRPGTDTTNYKGRTTCIFHLAKDSSDSTAPLRLSVSLVGLWSDTESDVSGYTTLRASLRVTPDGGDAVTKSITSKYAGAVNTSASQYYRFIYFPDEYVEFPKGDGDTFTISCTFYDANNYPKYAMFASGTIYYPIDVTITPPASVATNALNVFNLTQVTVRDDMSLQATGRYASTSCAGYIDATTSCAGYHGDLSNFTLYPLLETTEGLFPDGSAETFSVSISATYSTGAFSNIPYFSASWTGDISKNINPPAAAKPSVTVTQEEVDGAGLLARYGKYIKGKSAVKFTASCVYRYGAVENYFDMVVGYNWGQTKEVTIRPTEDGTAEASCSDDHGAEASAVSAYSVYDYWEPELSTFAIHRCDWDGTNNDYGAYVKIEWGINVAPLGNQNSKSLVITHPQGNTNVSPVAYDSTGQLIVAANTEQSYDITIALTDDFTTLTRTTRLSTAGAVLDIYAGGKGIAFGKVAESPNVFEVTPDWLLKFCNAAMFFSTMKHIQGQIVDGENTTVDYRGIADVIGIGGAVAVFFQLRVEAYDSVDTTAWGINRDLLTEACGFEITPKPGGIYIAYRNSASFQGASAEYWNTFQVLSANPKYWVFSYASDNDGTLVTRKPSWLRSGYSYMVAGICFGTKE